MNCANCGAVMDLVESRRYLPASSSSSDAPGSDRGSRHVPRIDDEFIRRGLFEILLDLD